MKWFGRKAATPGERPALGRGWSGQNYMGLGHIATFGASGSGLAEGSSYESQVRSAVVANPVAQRSMRLVCEGAGGAPVVARGGAEGSAGEADRASLLALLLRRSGGQALVETLAMHLLLHGNAYVQIGHDAQGRPADLYALRPERVSVEADARGWPMAYAYRVRDGVTRLPSEDAAGRTAVIHLKCVHPLDDHYGLGCLSAAAGAVAIHNVASAWNKALLDNAARPSGALVHAPADGVPMSPDQFDRLRAELETLFSGSGNAGRPMLLEGGLSWQAMSLSPADMDFVGLKGAAAREIALAFGVPPMLVGLPGDTAYANYKEANRALWRQTILPMLERILRGVSQGLEGWFPGVSLGVDMDGLSVLAEERGALWAQVAAADFLSDDEKRAMVGLARDGQG